MRLSVSRKTRPEGRGRKPGKAKGRTYHIEGGWLGGSFSYVSTQALYEKMFDLIM